MEHILWIFCRGGNLRLTTAEVNPKTHSLIRRLGFADMPKGNCFGA